VAARLGELLGEGARGREQQGRAPAVVGRDRRHEAPQRVEVLEHLVLRRVAAEGEQDGRQHTERLALVGVRAQRGDHRAEVLGLALRQLLAAQDERVHGQAHEPVAPRREDTLLLGHANEHLEQLERRGGLEHARVHQLGHEAREPADRKRRMVVEGLLQLLVRARRDCGAEVGLGPVEQPDQRAVHCALRLKPVRTVEDGVHDQLAVARQVALQGIREALNVSSHVGHVLVADLDYQIGQPLLDVP
jgi:hypothetical protein